jgi:hypothetical protein
MSLWEVERKIRAFHVDVDRVWWLPDELWKVSVEKVSSWSSQGVWRLEVLAACLRRCYTSFTT